ncbi:MAG TPA: hypothetical protein VHX88_11285, partial [Solirubrobacteraceae bacterium]|nr:hypothetical protein [Solirubrobacteraceae bacterium]
GFFPGNLVVSTSQYTSDPSLFTPGTTQLPPGCTTGNCGTAVANGDFPQVFDNDSADGSFGVTSKIVLDQISPFGQPIDSLEVPNSTERGIGANSDQMVTSFSSKSELALNLSTNGQDLTFMGYKAPVDAVDASNGNTPGVIDPTNPVPGAFYRVVGEVDAQGRFHFTETNAYSGDNGRAAILDNSHGSNLIYAAGNAGNGSSPEPVGVIEGAGAQLVDPQLIPEAAQDPGAPKPLGGFSVTQLGEKADKSGKDTNFRGLGIDNNVVYYTKGSGSNGINTVYFVDTTGRACPGTGVGLPVPGAPLPDAPLSIDPSTLQADGLPPNMCILKGFPTTLAKTSTWFPFGVWFANPDTLYVADEGDGTATYSATSDTYTDAASQATAGLQKWVFNGTQWNLAYTLTAGLNLGKPYSVPGYPTGTNSATGLPWSPATDGLRNLTGIVNPGTGQAAIWAITSTVSGSGDQGADPNKLVEVTDNLSATSPPGNERFTTVKSAGDGEVLRGVSFTPGTFVDGSL